MSERQESGRILGQDLNSYSVRLYGPCPTDPDCRLPDGHGGDHDPYRCHRCGRELASNNTYTRLDGTTYCLRDCLDVAGTTSTEGETQS